MTIKIKEYTYPKLLLDQGLDHSRIETAATDNLEMAEEFRATQIDLLTTILGYMSSNQVIARSLEDELTNLLEDIINFQVEEVQEMDVKND